MTVTDDVLAFIADKVVSNIRELEGALNKVIAYSSLTDNEISVDMCAEALKEILAASNNRIIDTSHNRIGIQILRPQDRGDTVPEKEQEHILSETDRYVSVQGHNGAFASEDR